MTRWFDQLRAEADRHPGAALAIGAAAAVVVAAVLWWGARSARRTLTGRMSSALINLAALMATAVQSAGMWKFFATTMALPLSFRIFLFSFMEVALLACGTRAKENVREGLEAGVDGVLVVVLAIGSGALSATDASSWQEVLVRLMVSVVAALLWRRDLMAIKHEARQAGQQPETLRWRFGIRTLAVRWGLADAGGASLADHGVNRVFDQYVRATHVLARWTPGTRQYRRAARRRNRAHVRLMSYSRLNSDLTGLLNTLGAVAVAEGLTMLGVDTRPAAVEMTGRGDIPAETPRGDTGAYGSEPELPGRGDVSTPPRGRAPETFGGDNRPDPPETSAPRAETSTVSDVSVPGRSVPAPAGLPRIGEHQERHEPRGQGYRREAASAVPPGGQPLAPADEAAAAAARAAVNGRGQALLVAPPVRRRQGLIAPETPQRGDTNPSGVAETRAGDVPASGHGSVSTHPSGAPESVSGETDGPEDWTFDEATGELAKQLVAEWPIGQRVTQRAFLAEFRARGGTVSNRGAGALHRYAISPDEPDEDDD